MNDLLNQIYPGVRLNLHYFGPATVTKVGMDHQTDEIVAQVSPDAKGSAMFLSLAYCARVLAIHSATL